MEYPIAAPDAPVGWTQYRNGLVSAIVVTMFTRPMSHGNK
jgi:hypothetical protein